MSGMREGEGGAHWHALVRPEKRTAVDGAHRHVYLIGDQLVFTEFDGSHYHGLESENADESSAAVSGHTHAVVVGGKVFRTVMGGEHTHGLQATSTVFDGLHGHPLVVDGVTYNSLTPGQFWEWMQTRRAAMMAQHEANSIEQASHRECPVNKAATEPAASWLPPSEVTTDELIAELNAGKKVEPASTTTSAPVLKASDDGDAIVVIDPPPVETVPLTVAVEDPRPGSEADPNVVKVTEPAPAGSDVSTKLSEVVGIKTDDDLNLEDDLEYFDPDFDPNLEDVDKRLARPFGSPGGKRDQLGELLKRIPSHSIYVEPYAGSASLFWAKEPVAKEVLSDIDDEIIDCFRFLKGGSDKDFEWMRAQEWKGSPELFAKIMASKGKTLRGRAYRFKYLNLHSKRRERTQFANPRKGGDAKRPASKFLGNLEKYRERLKNTTLLTQDALTVMKRFDVPDSFHYIDPPWKDMGAGREPWRNFDKAAFVKTVSAIKKAKALVSFQGGLDELVKAGGWKATQIEFQTTGFRQAKSTQDLVTNYSKMSQQNAEAEELIKAARAPGGRWPCTASDATTMMDEAKRLAATGIGGDGPPAPAIVPRSVVELVQEARAPLVSGAQ